MYEPKESKPKKPEKKVEVAPIIDQFVEPITDYSKLLADLDILIARLKDNGVMNQELLDVIADLNEIKGGK